MAANSYATAACVAEALKKEAQFPYPLKNKNAAVKRPLDPKKDPGFQTKDRQSAPKNELSDEISANKGADAFCMVHGEFIRHSLMDGDHAILRVLSSSLWNL